MGRSHVPDSEPIHFCAAKKRRRKRTCFRRSVFLPYTIVFTMWFHQQDFCHAGFLPCRISAIQYFCYTVFLLCRISAIQNICYAGSFLYYQNKPGKRTPFRYEKGKMEQYYLSPVRENYTLLSQNFSLPKNRDLHRKTDFIPCQKNQNMISYLS